jgi:triacylglycerol lipase
MIHLNFSNKLCSFVLLFSLLLTAGCISKCRKDSDYCASKYPVLLIHGVAFRDETFFIKYWGNIPSSLIKDGAKVFTGKQQAYGTIRNNAQQLKERVDEILKITGSDKVNIIAHSRGGLEARYMISMLGMGNKVASLTTLATPHRGSTMADYIIKHAADKKLLPVVIDFYAKVIGDTSPESLNAGIELTTLKMKEFNNTVKDTSSVYYQSYACAIDSSFFNPLWRSMYNLIAVNEGPNDGLVSVKSAQWGNFRGVVNCNGKALVTHADIVGMHFLSGEKCFDADEFIRNIVHELKVSGY